MPNSEPEKRRLRALIQNKKDLIQALQERVREDPKNLSAKTELSRQKNELQGLISELNS